MVTSNIVSIDEKRDAAKRWPADVFGWKNKQRLPGDVAISDMANQTGSVSEIDWDMTILWNRRYADAARNWAIYASRDLDDYFKNRPAPVVFRDMVDRLPRTQLRAIEHLQETVAHILRSVSDIAGNPWMIYDPETGIWAREGEWLPEQAGYSVNIAVAGVIRSFLDALNRSIDLLTAMVNWVVPPIEKPDKSASDDEKKEYAEHEAKRNELKNRIKESHKFAQSIAKGVFKGIETELRKRLAIKQDLWDSETRYLVLKDGVIDLKETHRTGETVLEEFSPLHFSSMRLDIAWHDAPRNAGLSEWDRGVNKILPNPEVREYLQKRYGAALLGTPAIAGKSMVWQYGPGDTAKSTIMECIAGVRGVFHQYSYQSSSKALTRRGQDKNAGDLFIASTRGKRFAIFSELPDGEMLDGEIVKRLTGGDSVEGTAKYSNPVRYYFSATLFMSSNHPPSFPPGDTALQNRIHVVPFKHKFWVQSKNPEEWAAAAPEDRADESWQSRVLDSAQERSSILRWVIEGLVAFGRDGGIGDLPEAMQEEHDEFVLEADPVATLVSDLLGHESSDPWVEILTNEQWTERGLREGDGVPMDRIDQLIKAKAEALGMVDPKTGQVARKLVHSARRILDDRGGSYKPMRSTGCNRVVRGMTRMLEVTHATVSQSSNKWGL